MKEHPILVTKPLTEQGDSDGILFISGNGTNPPQYLAIDRVAIVDVGGTPIVSGFRTNVVQSVVKFPNETPWLFVDRAVIDIVPRAEFQRDMLFQEHTQQRQRLEQIKELEAGMPLKVEEVEGAAWPESGLGQYL